ncbi:MAG TPA: IS701 family transposase, partial [Streptosporangiaceae bacterium]
MTRLNNEVAAGAIVEDGRWLGKLHDELRGLLAPVFAQARSRLTAFAYIGALLAVAGDRKSCWQLAERAGHATPRRMQALLAEYAWDWEAALSALQRFVVARLGDPEAIVVLDETAELKKGTETIGVGRQHAGITGQVENCQTVVFAAYVTARAHALFDFRLYLPKQWCGDRARRQRAHVPDDVAFTTKPALGTQIVTGAAGAGVPFAWVAADEVYGRSTKLREACEKAGKGYALAVPVNFQVTLPSGRKAAAASVAAMVPGTAWETRSCGHGCKGHRDYAWAWAATASPRHWLLIRRSLSDPSDLAFFYCHAPEGRPVSLPVLIRVAGKRWPVEVGHCCYLSSGVCLSRLPSLSFFLRFAGFCLGWCPAGAGVVAGRAVPALAELAHLLLAGGDDPVPAPGCAAGGDPAAVDPVVDAGGGHAELGGQSRDGPLAWVQVREDGGPALGILADGVLADDVADLLAGEDRGALGRPVSRGVERAGDLPAVASLAGEPGDGLQEGRVVGELVQAADR